MLVLNFALFMISCNIIVDLRFPVEIFKQYNSRMGSLFQSSFASTCVFHAISSMCVLYLHHLLLIHLLVFLIV